MDESRISDIARGADLSGTRNALIKFNDEPLEKIIEEFKDYNKAHTSYIDGLIKDTPRAFYKVIVDKKPDDAQYLELSMLCEERAKQIVSWAGANGGVYIPNYEKEHNQFERQITNFMWLSNEFEKSINRLKLYNPIIP